ncbi:nuclear transport factor 2 family protein [Ekhidna sp.]|uniref:nuclear transport factor 2 family protein n=1 Tax=Ekhidna sp. TaxID=2608089 RepID=UPI003BA9F1C5
MAFKQFCFFIYLSLIACEQPEMDSENDIKKEIQEMYLHHVSDLKNLDHENLMRHYADINDHILFGDGEYWGDYKTVNNIWKSFIDNTQQILKWELSNEKIHILSNESASYLMEYYNERINSKGDTSKVKGSAVYALKKINNDWKIVTTNVTHQILED